jgi:hypothetical protein
LTETKATMPPSKAEIKRHDLRIGLYQHVICEQWYK